MRRLIAALLLALVVSSDLAGAAELEGTPEVVALYGQAEAALNAGNWQEARRITEELATRFADSPHRDLFLFDHAKATYHSGDYVAAMGEFEQFQSQFPNSPYTPYASYFWANAALAQRQTGNAIPAYLKVYDTTNDPRLRSLIADAFATFDRRTLGAIFATDTSSTLIGNSKCRLIRDIAGLLVEQQRIDDASLLLRVCDKRALSATDKDDSLPSVIRIGVVVPLSGEYQQYGQEILNGAMVAMQSSNPTGRKLHLLPFDTQSDPVMAGRISKELARLNYDAIIGPLTSDEAAVVAASLTDGRLPVLIPAATGAGLTLLGSNAYQLSPNLELQGIRVAEYARRTLNADTAVILTPTGVDYLQMGQAFAQRFEQLGGTILGVEYYRSSDRDFGNYIRSVKKLILRGFDDSATYLDARGDTVEAEAVTAQVDCMYMPGPTDQLRLLVPQLRFYNLTGAYLGSDGWGSQDIYGLGDDVCRGAVFASPFIQKGSGQRDFTHDYTARYGDEPTRLASLGYDAAHLLLQTLAKLPPSRVDWVTDLAKTANYDGAAGRITFGSYRENVELPLYKIQAGKPVLIGLDRGATATTDPAE